MDVNLIKTDILLILNFPIYKYTGRKNEYDLIVIGGGSGGLACSKQAAELGAKTALLDFVEPSPQVCLRRKTTYTKGTTWGLGGTCVNVGCIPKKLLHHAATVGETIGSSGHNGWEVGKPGHDWTKLNKAVVGHVRSLNWGFRVQLKSKNVEYFNALGSLVDKNTVKCTYKNGDEKLLRADKIVLATGMRPKYPDIKGAMQYAITSDDIFFEEKPPGKTLVIGASYVALECAGFLTGFGYDTTVMMRSIPLRGFDQQMASLVVGEMRSRGTKFLLNSTPNSLSRANDGSRVNVTYDVGGSDDFDTVLLAIGRRPLTSGFEAAGVRLDSAGYAIGRDGGETTSLDGVYALGDILKDGSELTPVAIKAGRLLAHRLFNAATETMHYQSIATTVFTPLEYACVGQSEEDAISSRGQDSVEVYHAYFTPLEYVVSKQDASNCYVKVITERGGDEKIIGIHYTGPNAGEIMQGFSVAFRNGLTKKELDLTIGIHPTTAENLIGLAVTKRSGLEARITGC